MTDKRALETYYQKRYGCSRAEYLEKKEKIISEILSTTMPHADSGSSTPSSKEMTIELPKEIPTELEGTSKERANKRAREKYYMKRYNCTEEEYKKRKNTFKNSVEIATPPKQPSTKGFASTRKLTDEALIIRFGKCRRQLLDDFRNREINISKSDNYYQQKHGCTAAQYIANKREKLSKMSDNQIMGAIRSRDNQCQIKHGKSHFQWTLDKLRKVQEIEDAKMEDFQRMKRRNLERIACVEAQLKSKCDEARARVENHLRPGLNGAILPCTASTTEPSHCQSETVCGS